MQIAANGLLGVETEQRRIKRLFDGSCKKGKVFGDGRDETGVEL